MIGDYICILNTYHVNRIITVENYVEKIKKSLLLYFQIIGKVSVIHRKNPSG